MEDLQKCPLCDHPDFTTFLNIKDYTVSHETFSLLRCASCNFVFTNPRPSYNEIGKYYQSDEYISHSNTTKGLINYIYHQVRKISISGKIRLIESLKAPKKLILDYGSGTGEFLNMMKINGWKIKGVEPAENAREQSISKYELDITEPGPIFNFQDEEFGIITLWHVLEHIHKLKETIEHFRRCIIKKGYLIIAVPNRESWDASYYKEYWAGYDVPRHLYHFTINDITKLFKRFGFHLTDVRPMVFDPFYISLLSEKYKNGKINYLKAIEMGIKTNMAGKKNISKNSSLIYILQKN